LQCNGFGSYSAYTGRAGDAAGSVGHDPHVWSAVRRKKFRRCGIRSCINDEMNSPAFHGFAL
jgi:hypothetical protein